MNELRSRLPLSLKALLFDVDGTLYSQGPVRRRMAMHLAKELLFRPVQGWRELKLIRAYRKAQEHLRTTSGLNGEQAQLELACDWTGHDAQSGVKIVERWMNQLPMVYVSQFVRPGVAAFVSSAHKRGLALGVVSDYRSATKLEALTISQYFPVMVCSQESMVGEFKPSPKGLRLALDRLGVSPDDAMYIGDRPEVDAEAARRAGMTAVIIQKPLGVSADGWIGIPNFKLLGDLLDF